MTTPPSDRALIAAIRNQEKSILEVTNIFQKNYTDFIIDEIKRLQRPYSNLENLATDSTIRQIIRQAIFVIQQSSGNQELNIPDILTMRVKKCLWERIEKSVPDEDILELISKDTQKSRTLAIQFLYTKYATDWLKKVKSVNAKAGNKLRINQPKDFISDAITEFVRMVSQGSYRHEGKLSAYVKIIIRNRVLNEINRRENKEDRPISSTGLFQSEPPSRSLLPDMSLMWKEKHGFIHECINTLAQRKNCKELLILRFIEQKKYKEIAEYLDMTLAYVRFRLHQCRGHLKECLAQKLSL